MAKTIKDAVIYGANLFPLCRLFCLSPLLVSLYFFSINIANILIPRVLSVWNVFIFKELCLQYAPEYTFYEMLMQLETDPTLLLAGEIEVAICFEQSTICTMSSRFF